MKPYIVAFTFLLSACILGACSSPEENLASTQDDMVENVKENIVQVREKTLEYQDDFAADPEAALEHFDEFTEEFVGFLEEEAIEQLKDSRTYLNDYATPETEEAQEYFDLYKATMEAYIPLLEANIEFNINLLQDNLSEADVDEYDEQMLQFDKEINQKLERLSTLTDKYEEKYDMHFIDPIY